jgi:hypothetical protein
VEEGQEIVRVRFFLLALRAKVLASCTMGFVDDNAFIGELFEIVCYLRLIGDESLRHHTDAPWTLDIIGFNQS